LQAKIIAATNLFKIYFYKPKINYLFDAIILTIITAINFCNMKKVISLVIVLSITVISVFSQVSVKNLLCENLANPIGLDIKEPRFSWQLVSEKRNLMQTAYELKVMLGKKAVWNSGKTETDQSVFISYAGTPLIADKKYNWQVRVWDNEGNVSGWSEMASFQTAFFSLSDWKAKWIEAGFAEDSVNRPAQYFRNQFSVSKKIVSATAYITAHGMYEAQLNGKRIGDAYLTPGWTSYNKRLQYQVYDVTSLLNKGDNAVGLVLGNGWYRGFLAWGDNKNIYGKKLGLLFQLNVSYSDGSSATFVSDESWRSSTGTISYAEIYHGETIDARNEKKGWTMAGYKDDNWSGVNVQNYSNENLLATYNEPVKKHETFSPVKIFKTPAGEQVIDFGQNLVGWVMIKVMRAIR
jgi:alpha-L-rhamnosidase